MKLIQFSTDGVKFLPNHNCWFGVVAMTLKEDGASVAQNVEVKIRVKGNLSQSYPEAQEAIRAEAISVLSHAIGTLHEGTLEEIDAEAGK